MKKARKWYAAAILTAVWNIMAVCPVCDAAAQAWEQAEEK